MKTTLHASFFVWILVVVSFLFIVSLALAQRAEATSVMWSTDISERLFSSRHTVYGNCTPIMHEGTHVDVQYHARVVDTGTGEVVACGGTVAEGTQLRFEFIPHQSDDVYWFGTGRSWDSPYGDWIENAAKPSDDQFCIDKNMTVIVEAPEDGSYFFPLSVNPPAKSIAGLESSALNCRSPAQDGSVLCTAEDEGTATAQFIFEPTFGYFYFGHNFLHSDDLEYSGRTLPQYQCHLYDDPLFIPDSSYRLPNTHPQSNGEFICGSGDGSGDGLGLKAGLLQNGILARIASVLQSGITSLFYGIAEAHHPNPLPEGSSIYTLQVPEQTISCPITVIDTVGSPPTAPSLSASGTGQCVVGTPYNIQMTATDPDGDKVRYGIDWDNNGTIDQFVPPSGYFASGATQNAQRTYATAGSKTIRVLAQDEGGLTSSWSTYSFVCAESQITTSDGDDGGAGVGGFTSGSGSGSGGSGSGSSLPTSTIRAIPSLVRSGGTTQVHWSATNVESCAVTADSNSDSWEGAISPVVGETSSPIVGSTVYTLTCNDSDGNTLTDTATVSIVPVFQEI